MVGIYAKFGFFVVVLLNKKKTGQKVMRVCHAFSQIRFFFGSYLIINKHIIDDDDDDDDDEVWFTIYLFLFLVRKGHHGEVTNIKKDLHNPSNAHLTLYKTYKV